MSTIDYAALGFRFTAADAAAVIQISVAEVNDLIRTGDLAFLTYRAPGPLPQLTVLFHSDEVADFSRRRREDRVASDVALAARVQAALRRYLREVQVEEDYDEALERGAPLLAGTKQGDALHIQVPSLVAFYNQAREPHQAILTEHAVAGALERLKALRVRGVIPVADRGGKQRWGTWWRIPLSLLDGDNTEAAARDVVDGVRAPEEKLRRYGTQGVFLDAPLGTN